MTMSRAGDYCLDDLAPGMSFETGAMTINEGDIIAFARQFDPQYFHLDPDAARASAFGGLIASGLHTLSVSMRLFFDLGLWPRAIIGSPGMNEIRWVKPVHPDDTLTSRLQIAAVTPSRSKPDRGVVTTRHETLNQRGETVLTFACLHMLYTRAAVEAAAAAR
ncbi:acyl dehydratase [Tepidamorphus gemmatus]|jgi:acyl dehydratase|uniref:Acyl dehydratase n=1 Tax=Tepidamorphus gemmatus TaxID=747076 RepID=A0A4R3MHR6_9HYPH|nr:MaoC family dehydratase [Tepidamorphus gemmatus]TCT13162.1 acyl dehydratase [Tepidamorphus gemmatus]